MKKEKLCAGDKRLLLVALLVVIISIIIGLCIREPSEEEGYTPSLPEININGNLDYEGKTAGGIAIPTSQGYNLLHGQTEQEINLSNPSTNTCDFIISIFLSDGTLLYQSDRVVPGESLTEITILQPLKAGIYRNSVVVYDCYKHGTQEPITRIEAVVELNCI